MAAAVAVVVILPSGTPIVRHRHHANAASLRSNVEQIPVFNLCLLNFYHLNVFMFMATEKSLSLAPCGPVPVVLYSCIVIRKYSRM